MNVFVPFPSIEESVAFLDDKRLNKQVAECAQIIRQLDVWPNGGWANHPAIRMWVGHSAMLYWYMLAAERERLKRGFNPHKEIRNINEQYPELSWLDIDIPPWWGRPDVHNSHLVNLQLKMKGEPHGSYVWPI